MYITDEDVQHRVIEHYEELKKRIPEEQIVGVFLQGSQNYGLGYEGSDVDTKAIVLPSFEDFVLNKQPMSTTIVLDNDEHIDTKDIRVMFSSIKKQNINFVEILFTKYKLLNPTYKDLFQPILDIREEVGRYNIYAALNCMAGMTLEKRAALTKCYPTTAWKIDKYGLDSKQLQHIIRVNDFIKQYLDGVSYETCLKAINPQYQIDLKANRTGITVKEAKEIADRMVIETKLSKDQYMNTHENKINSHVDEIMHKVLFDILTATFARDIENHKTK